MTNTSHAWKALGSALLVMLCGRAKTDVERIVADVTIDGKPAHCVLIHFWPKDDLHLGSYQGLVREGRVDIEPNKRRSKHPGRFGVYFRVPPPSPVMVERGIIPTRLPSRYLDEKSPQFEFQLEPGVNELGDIRMSEAEGAVTSD